ncbi:MAG: hypothetical protein MO846_09260 [Candidatus Devosia symbiotica]|nr:hypothetical protein [Candidatus Devosia symbiotica]
MLFDAPPAAGLALADRPRHTEVLRIDTREIYLAGYMAAIQRVSTISSSHWIVNSARNGQAPGWRG